MARFIRFAACQSSALPEAKASDTIRTKISNFRYKSSRSVSALAIMLQPFKYLAELQCHWPSLSRLSARLKAQVFWPG